jgi:iron complex outermembrane recepter protein
MNAKRLCLLTSAISAICHSYIVLGAEENKEDVEKLDTFVAEESVDDGLGVLQADPVDSVFGFGKTIIETPRAVSSISSEFLDQFNATGINDIVNFVPGTFTTSFFGVAGSLDIRGTSAENYFRGVKRLNNEGNYPTPIGATDRVDVIRGPMSPISGPSKVGGALNFIPKSARAETGQYMPKSTGAVSYTTGSWDRSILSAEAGGPTEVMGKAGGFYLYGELHDSGSYYNNDFTNMSLLQASFNFEISASTRVAFGAMFQDWSGHENGGWNRVTQELVDNGTYVTGSPLSNIDGDFGNSDGLMQESEIDKWEASLPGLISTGTPFTPGTTSCFTGISVFCFSGDFEPLDPTKITQQLVNQMGMGLNPATVGKVKLNTNQVLITERDRYDTEVHTLYFDIMHDYESGWNLTNKVFYDAQEYINVDSYGFTKIADAWVVEDQLIFSKKFEMDDWTTSLQVSPSYRYTDAFYALDFSDEIFDRTDLTKGFTARSRQEVPSLAPTPDQESWSDYIDSQYAQYGFSVMSDTNVGNLNVLLGARYDYIDAEGENGDGAGPVKLRTFDPDGEHKASNDDSGVTWTASLSYKLGPVTPYVTAAKQNTIVSGSAADISAANIKNKTFLGESELQELGIKTSLLDGRLFAAVAVYEQERIAFNAQSPVSNQAANTQGTEFEFRYVPFDKLSLVATYSTMEVKMLTPGGVSFTYIGASDLPQLTNQAAWYGGIIGGNIKVGEEPLRGGIPEQTYSMSASYKLTDTLNFNASLTSVDEVASGVLGTLILPAYELVNLSMVYSKPTFTAGLFVNNVTNETYFRGNFPSLYGNNAILPELPRNWRAEVTYKF